MADNLTPQAVKTKTAGDVKVDVAQYNGTSVGAGNALHVQPGTAAVFAVSDNSGSLTVDNAGTFLVQDSQVLADNGAFVDGTSKLFMSGFIFDETAGTALTENDAAAARVDSKRAIVNVLEDATTRGQRAAVSAAGRLSVDASGVAVPVTDNAGSLTVDAPVGTPVAVRLSDGSAFLTVNSGALLVDTELPAAASLADATANPSLTALAGYLMGFNGTTWDRVRTANTGRLQVDVISGGGSSTPTTPVMDPKTSSALGPTASVDVDSTDVGSATKKLTQVTVASAAPLKGVLKTVANAVETIVLYFMVPINGSFIWTAPHPNFVTQAPAGAGFDGFRVSVTNMDNGVTTDVYVTYATQE